MSAEPLHLVHPLWLVAAAALAAYGAFQRLRTGRPGDWMRAVDRGLMAAMARRGGLRRAAGLRAMPLAAIAGALIAVALADPSLRSRAPPSFRNTRDLVLLLDMSPQALASGVLDDIRAAAGAIVQHEAGRPVAVILFNGEAYVASELTTDPETPESVLAALDAETMPGGGDRPQEALALAGDMLAQSRATGANVVLIGAGGGVDDAALAEAERLRALGATVSTIQARPQGGEVAGLEDAAMRKLAERGGGDLSRADDFVGARAALDRRSAQSAENSGLAALQLSSCGRLVLALALAPAFFLLRRRA